MTKQKGFTLIEVLVTLIILMIVSTVIYSVFISIFKNYSQINEKNNLQQDANVIITTIKNYHLGTTPYQIKYSNKHLSIYINGSNIPLGNPNTTIDNFKVIYNNNSYTTGDVTIDDTSQSLNISITLSNKQMQTYTTGTIISRY